MKHLKLLGWIVLYLAIYFFSSIIGGIVVVGIYFVKSIISGHPLPFESFIAGNLSISLIIAAIFTVGFCFLILLIRGHNPMKYLEFRRMPAKHTACAALLGASFAVFINSFLTMIDVSRFLPDYVSDPLVEMMTANMLLTFLGIGIIVPIYEEILVRGLIFKEMEGLITLWPALLLQGLIFGLMHGNALQFSYAFPMGVFLGYIYIKYRSIWAPILIHLVWNTTSLLMGALMPETSNPLVFLLLMFIGASVFVGGTLYSIRLPSYPPDSPAEQMT